ncbi:MAG: aminotransferase class V-fold PLP-dependent enzyme [Acidimicrobiales bacterium]|nr:aminotransferase class V-fold PLP-dependent enzyme [Acidimicrobiales bacterium]
MTTRSYLDHASTSPLRPEARAALVAAFDLVGDPGRIHAEGLSTRVTVEQARAQVADLLGARPREVVFTRGATEAIAAACWGAASRGRHQVVPAVEHSAVRLASGLHGDATIVAVDPLGRVQVDDLLAAVAEVEFHRLRERFDAVEETDPVERIRALGRAYVRHARDEPQLHRLMFRFPPQLAAAGLPLSFGPATEVFAAALVPVEQAIAEDLLVVDDPLVAALALWSAAHGVAEVLLMGFDFPDDMVDALVDAAVDSSVTGMLRARP